MPISTQKKFPLLPQSLSVLTSSALLLPGLITSPAQAEDGNEVDFQYSHYQEGKRAIYGSYVTSDPNSGVPITNTAKLHSSLNPIEVDSLRGSARVSLTDRVKFAFNYTQDTWSGATPIGTAPAVSAANAQKLYSKPDNSPVTLSSASPYAKDTGSLYRDKNGNFYPLQGYDPITGQPIIGKKNNQLTHVLSYASPETRKQGDFKLGYEWDEAALNLGGGISTENDYESRFVSLGGHMDFNQKRTSVNFGLGYTNSYTHSLLDPDAIVFTDISNYGTFKSNLVTGQPNGFKTDPKLAGKLTNVTFGKTGVVNGATLRGNRQDVGIQLELTQVLNKDAVLDLGMGYTRSTGYLGNPYKLVYALQAQLDANNQNINQLFSVGAGTGRLELRPDERNLLNWNLGYSQYVEPFDAAWHFNYRFTHDNWDINAHTFESDWVQPVGVGWSLTPHIRYYSQSQAYFYTPYITDVQVIDFNTGLPVDSPLTRTVPKYYSSDQRLSGFGTLSGGLTVAKQFAKGIGLEAGFEYYSHQGNLKLGGGGEQPFADFNYWVANAALKLNLDALSFHGGDQGGIDDIHHHHHHRDTNPAGVMFGHTLAKAGHFMAGYRYLRSEEAGKLLFGSNPVSKNTVAAKGCEHQTACTVLPKAMTMNMHMLDLMYAPADWLTLMLMPQWMDMQMDLNHLTTEGASGGTHHASIGIVPNHQVGGIGDTGVYALFKLFDRTGQHLNLSLGGTAPTGDVGVKLRKSAHNYSYDTLIHYGMQLGSGTWDFKPSLTYSGEADRFSWGAQVTGTKRLENRNVSYFSFGDIFQSSVWAGVQWTDWLGTTVRGIYTSQGKVRGQYPPILDILGQPLTHIGPMDNPANYGGEFFDLGLGINVNIPNGAFAGNAFKFEWLQPVSTHYNGYQLDRDHSLAFTWSYGF